MIPLRLNILAAVALCAALGLVLLTVPTRAAERCGIASYYAEAHHGKRMANGQRFDMHAMTAASPALPLGTRVRVTAGTRSVVVTITDRGPARRLHRILDLSKAAFSQLAPTRQGLVRACIERL